MKTMGIIGGLGPETTAKFYLEIMSLCQSRNKAQRPPILTYSVPLPYDIEREAIANGSGEERCLPFLLDAALRLEKSGADILVLPCNSLHAFIREVRRAVDIPVLSIVEATIAFLKRQEIVTVGLLATAITRKRGLYEVPLRAHGIGSVHPSPEEQEAIGEIIHDLVMDRRSAASQQKITGIIEALNRQGAEHILLACTDLQLLVPADPLHAIHDTMKILAHAAAEEILK